MTTKNKQQKINLTATLSKQTQHKTKQTNKTENQAKKIKDSNNLI